MQLLSLLKKFNDIQIILLGDGMEKEALLNFAVCNNLPNVTFMNPPSQKDLSKLFHVCHIGLQILADYPAFYYKRHLLTNFLITSPLDYLLLLIILVGFLI